MGGYLGLDLRKTRERLVPARFQFACHEPVGRIGCIILPKGAVDCVARRFQVALERVEHMIAPLARLPLRGNSGSDGARTDNAQQRILDSVIDAQTAKGNATGLAIVHPARLQL